MESQQPRIYAAVCITAAASTTTLVLRILARRTKRIDLWWDDYIAIAAWIFAMACSILVLYWLTIGLGLHIEDAAYTTHQSLIDVTSKTLLNLWIGGLFYAFSLGLTKLSVLCFYWRLFQFSHIRLGIQTLAALSILWICMRMILAFVQCIPLRAYWDLTVTDKFCPIDTTKFFTGSVSSHLIIEICIIALPIWVIRQLQLRTTQKIGVAAVFASGVLYGMPSPVCAWYRTVLTSISICASSVVQLVTVITNDAASPDVSWDIAPIILWAVVETNLACFAISLPMLRPVYVVYIRRRTLSDDSPNGIPTHSNRSGWSQFAKSVGVLRQIPDGDEGGSTYQLTADMTRPDASDGKIYDGQKGTSTAEISQGDAWLSPPAPLETALGGIGVKKETSVQISHIM